MNNVLPSPQAAFVIGDNQLLLDVLHKGRVDASCDTMVIDHGCPATVATKRVFSSECIAKQAECNVSALALGTMAYLKERGFSPSEWIACLGKRFASSWNDPHGSSVETGALLVALNLLTTGAELQTVSGTMTSASVVLRRNWLPLDQLHFFNVSQADADLLLVLFAPMVEALGFDYMWQREGDLIVVTISQSDLLKEAEHPR